jgi:hypothetical protein
MSKLTLLALSGMLSAIGSTTAQQLTPAEKKFLDDQEPPVDPEPEPEPRSQVVVVGGGYPVGAGIGQLLSAKHIYGKSGYRSLTQTGVVEATASEPPQREALVRRVGESETSFSKRERHAERAYQKAVKDYEKAQRKTR